MKNKLMALLIVLLFTIALAGAGSIKTSVSTFSQTNVLFKNPGDKDVGGGYFVSSNGYGLDKASLDFIAETNFELTEDRSIKIQTGATSTANGLKSFGMAAGLTQLYPTENGYRSSIFKTYSYTFMPGVFAIQQLLGGDIADNSAYGYNQNKLTYNDDEFNYGRKQQLDKELSTVTDLDTGLLDISGFGWENGFEYIDTVNECGMDYEGTMSTDSLLLVE